MNLFLQAGLCRLYVQLQADTVGADGATHYGRDATQEIVRSTFSGYQLARYLSNMVVFNSALSEPRRSSSPSHLKLVTQIGSPFTVRFLFSRSHQPN